MFRKYCYTKRKRPEYRSVNEIDHHFELLDLIGIKTPDNIEPEIQIEKKTIRFDLPEFLIQCHLTSSTDSRDWPMERWAELYHEASDLRNHLVFTGGSTSRELEKLNQLKCLIPQANVLDESLSLEELLQITKRASAVISPDTFIAHAAAGLDKKLIILYGPSTPEVWKPRERKTRALIAPNCHCKDNFYICKSNSHCMPNIRPGDVIQTLKELIHEN